MDQLTRRGNTDKEDPLPLFEPASHASGKNLSPKKTSRVSWTSRIRLRQLITYLVLWCALLLYFERIQVKSIIRRCHHSNTTDNGSINISLIADPQLVDDYSYPGRPNFVNYFAKKFSDNYLHRNYILQKQVLNPDAILFLGDLFDGGREWTDEYWYDEYHRFNQVFPKFPDTKTIMSLPGNHDIGFGNDVNITKLNRFRTFFGESNKYIIMGGFAIVMLDTISLSSNDTLVNSEPFQFLERLSQPDHEIKNYPTILLTHVPLYRFSDTQQCGPLRESKKKFPVMKGKQYQTVLEYPLSQDLLQAIQPVLIFSGDDHDYCQVTHQYQQNGEQKSATEITIKSVAMSAGIKYPAMQTLSLNPADHTYSTNICYMPTPFNTLQAYIWALLLQIASFIIIFIYPSKAKFLQRHWHHFISPKNPNILPIDIGDEKKAGNYTRHLQILNNLDWQLPETRSTLNCILNVIILIVMVWVLMISVFNRI